MSFHTCPARDSSADGNNAIPTSIKLKKKKIILSGALVIHLIFNKFQVIYLNLIYSLTILIGRFKKRWMSGVTAAVGVLEMS